MDRDIKDLSKEEIIHPTLISSIYDTYQDPSERMEVLDELMEQAKKYKVVTIVKRNIQRLATSNNVTKINNVSNIAEIPLEFNEYGLPSATIDNLINILTNDKTIKDMYGYNSLANRLVKYNDDGTYGPWTDSDDSALLWYIEQRYQIYHPAKFFNAFNIVSMRKSFNPVKELIENKLWDGVPRIDRFLTDILKCDDNDYTREVSRMIFYGGINRLYNPGCKFDYMPILIGMQGTGKSTIVKWLALNDAYYGDISSIEGKDALENIQGIWVCELSELLAMVKTKDVEAMKSFITRTTDRFRESYGRRTKEYPRTSIFIGTTNDYQFLSDKTGNRRYLPVKLNVAVGNIYKREAYIKDYILSCWREALALYNDGKTYLTIPSKYYDEVKKAQDSAVEDDPKTGMILDYLDKKEVGDRVCNIEIFTVCLNGLKKNFNRLESKEISRILSSLSDWKRSDSNTCRFENYGTQRYWEKIKPAEKWSDLD